MFIKYNYRAMKTPALAYQGACVELDDTLERADNAASTFIVPVLNSDITEDSEDVESVAILGAGSQSDAKQDEDESIIQASNPDLEPVDSLEQWVAWYTSNNHMTAGFKWNSDRENLLTSQFNKTGLKATLIVLLKLIKDQVKNGS